MNKFKVGDKVVLSGVNMSESTQHEVVKVGRTLVYIERHGRPVAYRIDTGVVNDDYGHTSIRTLEQFREDEDRAEAIKRLNSLGLQSSGWGPIRYSASTLNAVCDLLESEIGLPK